MGNKQEELEALVWSHRYDMIGISETQWAESCDWSAPLDGYRPPFGKDRQGKRGRRVALYVIEGIECMKLKVGNGTDESTWIRMKG